MHPKRAWDSMSFSSLPSDLLSPILAVQSSGMYDKLYRAIGIKIPWRLVIYCSLLNGKLLNPLAFSASILIIWLTYSYQSNHLFAIWSRIVYPTLRLTQRATETVPLKPWHSIICITQCQSKLK